MTTKKVFISLKMHGIPDDKIAEAIKEREEEVVEKFRIKDTEIECVNTFYDNIPIPDEIAAKGTNHVRLYRLGHAIMRLAECDYLYRKESDNSEGCIIEKLCSELYGLDSSKNLFEK